MVRVKLQFNWANQLRRKQQMKFSLASFLMFFILVPISVIGQPQNQAVFHAVLRKYCELYKSQENEIKASSVYSEANYGKKFLADTLNWSFSNWYGHVVEISTDQGGEWADLRIISDVSDFTIGFVDRRILGEGGIKKGSKIYNQLSRLKERDPVIFSGIFIKGERGIEELSLTERGSLCGPELIVRFTNIVLNPGGKELVTSSNAFWKGFSESFGWVWNYKWWLIGGLVVIAILRGLAENRKFHNEPSRK